MSGWIGVDLDGTLAKYDAFVSPTHIGEPVPAMVERVKRWLDEGHEVRIFTARVAPIGDRFDQITEVKQAIELWCKQHVGRVLEVTCQKDFGMIELWDDRCVRVQANTGQPCCQFWNHVA